MKRIFILLLVFGTVSSANGQINFTALYGNNSPLGGARYMPAMIGMDRASVHVDLVNAYIYAGNSSMSYKEADLLIRNEAVDSQRVEEILANLKEDNYAMGGATIQPLNFSFKVNDELALGFGWAERFETRFSFNGDLLRMVWRGNAPYENQEVHLGPADGNIMYLREFSVVGALHVLDDDDLSLWVGARPKYFQGLVSLYAPDNNFNVYTAPNGKYIDVTYDDMLNIAFDTTKPLSTRGNGFGFDLGGNLQIGENLHASLNLIDLGSVKFTKDVSNYSADKTVRYRGVELDNIYRDVIVRDSAVIDELTAHDKTNEAYNHPLPAKLILQGAYRIPGSTIDGDDYYKHSLFFTIVQGLSGNSSFGGQNIISVGGATDFGGMFNAGGNVNVIDFDQLQLGIFLGARLAVVRLAVGSSNIFPLLTKSGKTSDLNVTLGMSF